MEVSIEADEGAFVCLSQGQMLPVHNSERKVDPEVDPATIGIKGSDFDRNRPAPAQAAGKQMQRLTRSQGTWRIRGNEVSAGPVVELLRITQDCPDPVDRGSRNARGADVDDHGVSLD